MTSSPPNSRPSPKEIERLVKARYLMIPLNFLGSFLLLGSLGYALDKYLNSRPMGLVLGLLLGVVWSLYETFKIVLWANKIQR